MVKIDEFAQYKRCEKCSAGLEHLYIGGTGDWRSTILCLKCLHIRRGVAFEPVIVSLIAAQYGLSYDEALQRERRAQQEYETLLAAQLDHGG